MMIQKKHWNGALLLAGTASLLLLTASCLKSKFNPNNLGGNTPQAGVLFIHAAAGLSPVDVYGNNTLLNPAPMSYNGSTDRYVGLTPDYYTFKWDSSGTSKTIESVFESIPVNDLFTQFIYDSTDGAHRLATIPDIVVGTSLVLSNFRFIDLCPNVDRMQVYMGNSLVFSNRSFLDCNLNYNLDTFMTIQGGTNYPVTIKYVYQGDTLSNQATFYLNGGDIYTIFASGFAGAADSTRLTVGMAQNY
ncbi:MAG TPA: hypothetical protein VMV20_02925 [Chitinophagaceae bacterium]|nr:hypothetical protein [Chitinophagaceae bacterium]